MDDVDLLRCIIHLADEHGDLRLHDLADGVGDPTAGAPWFGFSDQLRRLSERGLVEITVDSIGYDDPRAVGMSQRTIITVNATVEGQERAHGRPA